MATTIYSALYRDPVLLMEDSYIYPMYGTTCLATVRELPDGKYQITQGFGGSFGFLYDPGTGRVHVGNERGETIFRVNDSQTRVCHGIGGYDDHLMVNSPDGAALASAAIASMVDDRLITPSTAPRSAHELMGDHHPGLADSVDSGNPDYLGYNSSVDPMNRYNDRSCRKQADQPVQCRKATAGHGRDQAMSPAGPVAPYSLCRHRRRRQFVLTPTRPLTRSAKC